MEPNAVLKALRKMCHETAFSYYYPVLYEAIKIVGAMVYDLHKEEELSFEEIDQLKSISLEEATERFRIKANIR